MTSPLPLAVPSLVPSNESYLKRLATLLEAGAIAFDRYQPVHVTSSAVIASGDYDRCLLIRHARLGAWLYPGGHIEAKDANPAHAAAREVLEETGLAHLVVLRLVDLDIHEVACRTVGTATHVDMRFGAVAPAGSALQHGSDAAATLWMSRQELIIRTPKSIQRPALRWLDWLATADEAEVEVDKRSGSRCTH